MEPACTEGSAKRSSSRSISIWYVYSFDEKYLLVERYTGVASS